MPQDKPETLRDRRRRMDRQYIQENILSPGSTNRMILDTLMGINHLATLPMQSPQQPNMPSFGEMHLGDVGKQLPPLPSANITTGSIGQPSNMGNPQKPFASGVPPGISGYFMHNPLQFLMGNR